MERIDLSSCFNALCAVLLVYKEEHLLGVVRHVQNNYLLGLISFDLVKRELVVAVVIALKHLSKSMEDSLLRGNRESVFPMFDSVKQISVLL